MPFMPACHSSAHCKHSLQATAQQMITLPTAAMQVSICRTLLDIVNGMSYLHGLGLLHA